LNQGDVSQYKQAFRILGKCLVDVPALTDRYCMRSSSRSLRRLPGEFASFGLTERRFVDYGRTESMICPPSALR